MSVWTLSNLCTFINAHSVDESPIVYVLKATLNPGLVKKKEQMLVNLKNVIQGIEAIHVVSNMKGNSLFFC